MSGALSFLSVGVRCLGDAVAIRAGCLVTGDHFPRHASRAETTAVQYPIADDEKFQGNRTDAK